MGRGGRGGKGKQRLMRRDFSGANKRADAWTEGRTHNHNAAYLAPEDLRNPAFEEYYQRQQVVPAGEWDAFLAALRAPLPTTFRINGSGKFAAELREKLESDFFAQFKEGPVTLDGEVLKAPEPLPWYPDRLAWQLAFSRNQLRKLPVLGAIHAFMKTANDAGSITRQEAVSMVPPLLMDVEPGHRVLDMCAAPGSKTFQLLEMLHEGGLGGGDGAPAGFVVANDADAQRCNLLVHQTKRMCSPSLMVANHNGEAFPRVVVGDSGGDKGGNGGGGSTQQQQQQQQQQQKDGGMFDRILCDVPCSGDGTMRKAPDIWRRWSVNQGNGLHNMQIRIGLQAARLLKVGGRMVYSTCTFNPIEDEAVVAELLLRCGGALELVDVSGRLPELRRCPGLTRWLVRDRHQWYRTWEEAEVAGFKLDPTMFATDEKAALPLQRCMRILPHHGDSGGFFVAVLRKVAPTPSDLQDPPMAHRFSRLVQSSRTGLITRAPGADPHAGARAAAEYALAAAERAVAALEADDDRAAEDAASAAAAAASRAGLALDAASESFKLQGRFNAQEARRATQQQQQQQEGGDGDDTAAPAAAAAADAMDEDGDADADGAAGAAAADGDDEELAAVPPPEEQEQEEEEPATTAGDGTAAEAAAAAAGGAADADDGGGGGDAARAMWKPSWVRGGGGRGRAPGADKGGGRFRGGVDPILPVEDPAIISMLVDFYGVEPSFPLATHLITRSYEAALPKRLYYVSSSLLALLLADEREALNIVATGLKLFERHELRRDTGQRCNYRIAQEGLPFLLPHVTKQRLRLSVDDFLRLLTEKNLPLPLPAAAAAAAAGDNDGGGGGAAAAGADNQQQQQQQPKSRQAPLATPEVLAQLESVQLGGAVALLEEAAAAALGLATASGDALTANAPLAISVWRTRASLSVLVSKTECEQMAEKLSKCKAAAAAAAAAGNGAGATAAAAAAAEPVAMAVA